MAGPHPSGNGFHPHLPGFKHQLLATTLGATMWFFILYRARKDGAKLLGHHPWGHGEHGHGEHAAGQSAAHTEQAHH